MLSSVGLTAALALAANAFLIPSTMSLPDGDQQDFNELLATNSPNTRIVKLNCPECSSTLSGYGDSGSQENNSMVLYFHVTNGDSLSLWDGVIYPKDKAVDETLPQIRVPVVDATSTSTPQDFDNSFDILYNYNLHDDDAADGSDAKLVEMDFSVLKLARSAVHVDALNIRMLRGESGELTIVDVVQVPNDKAQPAHADDTPETAFSILPIDKDNMAQFSCAGNTAFFCRVKSAFAAKVAALRASMGHRRPCGLKGKGAGKMRPHHTKGGVSKIQFYAWKFGNAQEQAAQDQVEQSADASSHPHPHPHHRHHGHAHHHGMHRFAHHAMRILQRFLVGVVLPILVGVAAGMTASLLGMVVGTIIAWVWIKVVRRGRKGNASQTNVRAEEGAVALEEEQKGLMEGEIEVEAPPLYVEKE